jgi:diguanylate cyclase (GGDEF)-like protein/PAS domain S-box-containing protein
VTGRHQAEAEMKKSISLLNATLDSSFDAVLVVNLNDTWELYNQKFVDLWQLPDEIVAAKNDRIALAHVLDQIVDPDAFIRRINELYDAPEISSCEMIALKNGKIIERFAYPQCIDNEVVGRVWTFRDVTLRENIEQTLKMEAQKNLALLHSASDGIHILDQNGIIIEVSDAFCAMLGYQREEMIGMYISEWDAVLNDAEIKQRLKARINLPGRSQFQTCHRRKDGGIINVEVSVVPLYLGDELVLFNSSRDITERKRAEKRISESENKYRLLIELAKDAIFLADAQSHTIIDCNISATKLLGKPKDEIIGLHQSKIHPPEKIEYYQQIFRSHIESGKDIAEDVMVLHHEGYHIPVDIHASVFYLDDRQVVLGIFREISDRKRAEAEMRIAATAFESQEGMLVTDDAGVILRVNRAFTEITGYMADEVIGKSPKMLSSGYHDRQFYAEIRDCIANSGSWDGEIWDKRKNGEIFPQHLSITAVKNEAGSVTNYVATFIDITSSKAAEDEIRSLAFYDALTGLPNRRLLLDRLGQALATSLRSGRSGAVLFLDLDHFKILNDTMGHDVGDLLLIQVAERLKECVREGDTVARLGGDEFIVMLEDLSEESTQAAAQVETISHKILTYLNQTYQLGKNEYRSASSIGIVIFNDDKFTQEDLLKQADIAMYQAKKSGRNTLRFFDQKMQEAISARVALERELRIALSEEQFQLHYQIQVDQFNRPIGAEVLLRWRHPEKGLLSPIEFIAVAEETGLILPIGLWVLDSACAQLMLWQQEARTEHLSLSVNVSAKQFRQDDFADQVRSMIARRRINTTKLKLELTESILMDNLEDTIMTMNVLRNLGVQFSLDDFGTGYSSLQYLKQLPLDQLKIDQTFVRDIVDDAHDRSIVRTIIAMANSLELNVIAEGVELIEQREILLNKGCTLYQGFLFGQPVSISEFENNLETLPFIFSGLPKN